MAKIIGIRDTVRDIRDCPRDRGLHVEVWSYLDDDGDVHVYASDWLSVNTWTTGHEGERQLDCGSPDPTDEYGDRISITQSIRQAVEHAWGISLGDPAQASAPKRLRRSGNSLVVAVTDLAGVIDAGEGDYVRVTIERVD